MMEHDQYLVVVATDATAAMRFAGRDDTPTDLGPPADPTRYKPGARRWGFRRAAPPPPDVLSKVRKLLTLAGNSAATEGEAANAAAAAQRLIEQHRLDVALLDEEPSAAAAPVEEPIRDDPHPLDALKSRVTWRGVLAGGIARANGCKHYWCGTHLRIIGAPSRVASVRQLYAWLVREVDHLGSEAARGQGRAYGHAWRVGCSVRIGERLREAAKEGQGEAKRRALGSGVALARVETALARIDADRERERVDAWTREHVKLVKGRTSSVRSTSGYEDGKAAGNRIRLSGPAALGRGTGGGGS